MPGPMMGKLRIPTSRATMNPVEIEEAVAALAAQPFDAEAFPYAFLEAFGNRLTTIKRLRSGASNRSDLAGGVLQASNIHVKVCPPGQVTATLTALRDSPATNRAKVKLILATDGKEFQAEDLAGDAIIVCDYPDFPDYFGVFLPPAGIATVPQIRENAFDVKATGRLNRLYVELRKTNPDWDTPKRRHDMNRFMAQLIFCFFAEDTGIFMGATFTHTVQQMSDRSNTGAVISKLFRAMRMKREDREAAAIARWARGFPYVNGGLFSGSTEVPRFSPIARFLPAPRRPSGLEADQPGHLRLHDPGRSRRRGTGRPGDALHQCAQHPESAQSPVSR